VKNLEAKEKQIIDEIQQTNVGTNVQLGTSTGSEEPVAGTSGVKLGTSHTTEDLIGVAFRQALSTGSPLSDCKLRLLLNLKRLLNGVL